MTIPLINPRDLKFQLYELLDTENLPQRPRFAEHSRETFDAAIDTAQRVAEQYFAPHNRELDENEPTFDGKRVSIIPPVKVALEAFADAGFLAAHHDYALGGMQLPQIIVQACQAYFQAANIATSSYSFLTGAAANVIQHFGSDEQKKLFLAPMLDGRFTGTMALTEPHAGSSLGDLRTAAEPQADGTYRISGNKIFISGGDHELSHNIVHLVLARIKGAPAGVKGISLFIVPKLLVNADGSLGARNDVALAGLLHKMGWRGTTSTMLNFGEQGGAVGYLIGEENQGLRYMFHMMNEARIGVGMGATMLGYAGYQYSLHYARNRPQGRHASARDFSTPQVPIIEHADVRRMLLMQKSYVEGALALEFYCATLVDDIATAGDEATQANARLLLDLLTPIAKAWPAQYCLVANKLAIQVLGGYGFTRDYPVEQYYRDNRLNPIHEGTNGIQALDLLGRKAMMQEGAALKLLLKRIGATVAEAAAEPECCVQAQHVGDAAKLLGELTLQLGMSMLQSGPDGVLANAALYLDLAGKVVISWMWLRQALVAAKALPNAGSDAGFYRGKLQAARYYIEWELPEIQHQANLLRGKSDVCLTMQDGWF